MFIELESLARLMFQRA